MNYVFGTCLQAICKFFSLQKNSLIRFNAIMAKKI
jgi:hypothetical protein